MNDHQEKLINLKLILIRSTPHFRTKAVTLVLISNNKKLLLYAQMWVKTQPSAPKTKISTTKKKKKKRKKTIFLTLPRFSDSRICIRVGTECASSEVTERENCSEIPVLPSETCCAARQVNFGKIQKKEKEINKLTKEQTFDRPLLMCSNFHPLVTFFEDPTEVPPSRRIILLSVTTFYVGSTVYRHFSRPTNKNRRFKMERERGLVYIYIYKVMRRLPTFDTGNERSSRREEQPVKTARLSIFFLLSAYLHQMMIVHSAPVLYNVDSLSLSLYILCGGGGALAPTRRSFSSQVFKI